MGPQAGVQGFDSTVEELDFQSVEVSAADIQAMAAAAGAGVGAGKKASIVRGKRFRSRVTATERLHPVRPQRAGDYDGGAIYCNSFN